MKTTLPIIAAIVAVSARAETPKAVEGFLGLPWGADSIDAQNVFAKRSGVLLDPSSNEEKLIFNDGKFAGLEVNHFSLGFVKGRFWRADVRFVRKSEGHEAEFLALKKLLIEKYGEAEQPDPNEARRSLDWHVKDPATGHVVHVNLVADPKGVGAWIVYACDRIYDESLATAGKEKPSEVVKPIVLPPDAKDDL